MSADSAVAGRAQLAEETAGNPLFVGAVLAGASAGRIAPDASLPTDVARRGAAPGRPARARRPGAAAGRGARRSRVLARRRERTRPASTEAEGLARIEQAIGAGLVDEIGDRPLPLHPRARARRARGGDLGLAAGTDARGDRGVDRGALFGSARRAPRTRWPVTTRRRGDRPTMLERALDYATPCRAPIDRACSPSTPRSRTSRSRSTLIERIGWTHPCPRAVRAVHRQG